MKWRFLQDGGTDSGRVLAGFQTIAALVPVKEGKLMASAPELLAALEAIQEAGRMSEDERARYMAEIARLALEKLKE